MNGLRVVLDTGVFVSTLLVKEGVPAQVFAAWRARRFQLVISTAIIDELRGTLAKPRIRKRERFTEEEVSTLVELLEQDTLLVPALADLSDIEIRNPNDLMVLATAANGEADIIVAGDKDLLVLGIFRGIPILTPRQFLDLLNEQ